MNLFQPCTRRLPLRTVLPTLLAACCAGAWAAPEPVDAAIAAYMQVQTAGLPGKATVRVDGRSAELPACDAAPEVFLPPGAAPWGRVSVGLRCQSPRPWTRYVQAHVTVEGRYFVAARAIESGRALAAADFTERTGDLTRLPRSVITSAGELAGVVAANRIASGAPLRKELVRAVTVIQQGQAVKVVAQGQGFVVSTEAKALTGATVGAVVQAKTRDGRLVSGVADTEGQIQMAQ
uniref:flagellar basal body P-ring formation chaperone FlgA n=1 Tax=unclassified Variovorax TaxID=663243 RepID=UPI000D3C0217